jgi:hypothetical protein
VSSEKIRVMNNGGTRVFAAPLKNGRTLIAPLVLSGKASCEIHLDEEAPEVTLTIHD